MHQNTSIWITLSVYLPLWLLNRGLKFHLLHLYYCHPPVADKHGEPVKSKTTPDFFLTHQTSRRQMYVEVTQGGGGGRHKAAQQRVVEAAGVENYIQIRGDEIATLATLLTPEAREEFLLQLFNW